MIGILILISISTLLTPITSNNIFSRSDMTFTLFSQDASAELPHQPSCSCQLSVFSVYDDKYSLQIRLNEERKGQIRLSLSSSGECMTADTVDNKLATFYINTTKYNGY